jgi:hypothetical protein
MACLKPRATAQIRGGQIRGGWWAAALGPLPLTGLPAALAEARSPRRRIRTALTHSRRAG